MHKVDSFLRESQRLHIVEPRAFLGIIFIFRSSLNVALCAVALARSTYAIRELSIVL
jgi:hypothetical protein